MAIVLGLLVSIGYGSADFVGGLAARRNDVLGIVIRAQLVGAVAVPVLALAVGRSSPSAVDLLHGAGAGLAGLVGLTFLFQGLASGTMGVVAPVTGVGTATVPVVVGLLGGERPSGLTLLGVAVALVAIVLVALEPSAPGSPGVTVGQVARALVAGGGFGVAYALIGTISHEAGMWPLVAQRLTTLVLAVSLSLATLGLGGTRRRVAMAPGTGWMPTANGTLEVATLSTYVVATDLGLLSVVGPLASLYPGATVVLARLVLDERLSRTQVVGLAVTAVGVALIAAG